MKRALVLIYGTFCYLLFLGVFLYLIGFLGDFIVPKSIDSAGTLPLFQALLINTLLLSLFAIQHSVMARKNFKNWITKVIPKSIERSTFVLATNVVFLLFFWQWQPIQGTVWNIENETVTLLIWGLFGTGWLIVLISTFLINHFELFGLQQVYNNLRQKTFVAPHFQTPLFYKIVRHPMMIGMIIAIWATPYMSPGHLIFAIGSTGYIFVGIYFEERDMLKNFGNRYATYQTQVPKIIPFIKGTKAKNYQPETLIND